ncbi:MAG: universal stress protein [Verrucomicrobiota bacterium]
MKKNSPSQKVSKRKNNDQIVPYPKNGFKKVLVPIDFSTPAQKLFEYALTFINSMDADMTLLYVCPKTALALVDEEKLEGYGRDYLEQQRRSAGTLQDRIRTDIITGVPSQEITQAAKKRGHDLIIITTHGNTGLKHVLLGSTAERIVRHASTPVLVHRERRTRTKSSVSHFKKILVPVDFSEKSRQTLAYAQSFAKDFGATIDIVHVVEPPAYPEFGYAHLAVKERSAIQTAKGQMAHFLEKEKVDMDLINSHSVKSGSAHFQITEWAKKKRSDLIILSTQGNTGLKHVLLGSTAERVVQHAACSVLVVR